MGQFDELRVSRRAVLAGLGAASGALLVGVPRLFGKPLPEASTDACLAWLDASLSPSQQRQLKLSFDHPSRQLANTVSYLQRPHVGSLLDGEQMRVVHRLFDGMLSRPGREAFAQPLALEAGGVEGCVLALYGDPAGRGPAQAVLMGGHLTVRTGGLLDDGVALGGAMAYGSQIGNTEFRIPGNVFAPHSDAANRLYAALDEPQRAAARRPTPPNEFLFEPQPFDGVFEGLAGEELEGEARDAFRALVDSVLATYPEADRADAWTCIEGNGGLDALRVAFYEDRGFYPDGTVYAELSPAERASRAAPYFQVWRIEGPGTVVHFKGAPHVHAYLKIVRDPMNPNMGEEIAETPRRLEGASLRRIVDAALRAETGEALAYTSDGLPARFCPGPITTGLVWTLDRFGDYVTVATIRGAAMAEPLRAGLASRGVEVEPGTTYRVATRSYLATRTDLFGEVERAEHSPREVRDVLVDYIRAHGVEAALGA